MEKNTLFREAALKHLSSPEQLDQLIQVVPSRAWLFIVGIYLLLIGFIIWLVLGSIPTRAEGSGILLSGNGDIYSAVAPAGPSHVQELLVKPGDKVTKGQIIATLTRPDLNDQISIAEKSVSDLNDKYHHLEMISQQDIASRQSNINTQREVLQHNLENNKKKLTHSEELLKIREEALKTGLEVRQNVDQTYQDYYNTKVLVEEYGDKIAQLDISAANFKDEWRERLRQLELKIADEKTTLLNLKAQRTLSLSITSPVAGIVTAIQATVGSIVNTGTSVLTIANEGKGIDALVYLPPDVGKRVKPGMKALITPTTVEKSEYGSIEGQVISVSSFPTTSAAIQSIIQNPDLVKKFTEKEVPIEIRIRLELDPHTFSGMKWTSSKGPEQVITPGNLVTSMITIREQPPITLIIPAFKKLAGIE